VKSERGEALIDGLLMLGVVVLIIVVAIQALFYAHARSVAQAAAQDGPRAPRPAAAPARASRAPARSSAPPAAPARAFSPPRRKAPRA
jgi:hypothetical protein